jgi:hypothetical protein
LSHYFLWFLVETILKYLGNFPYFWFKNFQINFWILRLKILRTHPLIFFKYSLVWFLGFCLYFITHNFCNKTTVWEKSIKAILIKNQTNFILLKLAKLVSRPNERSAEFALLCSTFFRAEQTIWKIRVEQSRANVLKNQGKAEQS